MVVVSDTSPLVHLARLGHLSLLRALYGHVLIPPAVWQETVEEGRGRAGAYEVREAVDVGWITVRPPARGALLHRLKEALDEGEAQALALASDTDADLVIVDEAPARRHAAAMDLPLTGTVGVLIRSKTEGELKTIRPALDLLRRASFWISDALYHRALEKAGEKPGS